MLWTKEILSDLRLTESRVRMETRRDGLLSLPVPEEVLEWFKLLGAGWVFDGNPSRAHAILHSGKHSTGFFLCKKVLKYGNLREILAACVIKRLREVGLEKVDGVFGAPYSSITLAADIARLLGVPNYVVEKDPKDPTGKGMIYKPDDPIPEGSVLLRAEELITTLDSCNLATQAIVAGNPFPVKFAPQIATLVWRPPTFQREQPDGSRIYGFIEKEVAAWDPPKCVPCAHGSKAVLPKTQWAELTA